MAVRTENLDGDVWRVDFDNGLLPEMLVSDRCGSKLIANDPVFRSLVCPAAMRQI